MTLSLKDGTRSSFFAAYNNAAAFHWNTIFVDHSVQSNSLFFINRLPGSWTDGEKQYIKNQWWICA